MKTYMFVVVGTIESDLPETDIINEFQDLIRDHLLERMESVEEPTVFLKELNEHGEPIQDKA